MGNSAFGSMKNMQTSEPIKLVDISQLTQLEQFVDSFSQTIKKGDIVFLQGDLGAGKTTFTQMLLKKLGFDGRVKSPTYAIYESYRLENFELHHMDLYRLSSAEELFYIGIDEIIGDHSVLVIEWPEKGKGVLPLPSKTLSFKIVDANSRELKLEAT